MSFEIEMTGHWHGYLRDQTVKNGYANTADYFIQITLNPPWTRELHDLSLTAIKSDL